MARYFFDIHNSQSLMRDAVGSECDSPEAVQKEAMETLPQIARDAIPNDGDKQAYTVLVRNEQNLTVYTATLTFAGLWLGEDIPSPDENN